MLNEAVRRQNPFAVGLPSPEWATEQFGAIRAEAEQKRADLENPGAFLLLTEVRHALEALRPDAATTPSPSADGNHLGFGTFLFHAFHLRALQTRDRPALIGMDAQLPTGLVDLDPSFVFAGAPKLPYRAGYLQLPRNRFWTYAGGEEAPPEPLDGLSWVRVPLPEVSGVSEGVSVMGVSGWILDRPGFSVIPLAPFPVADAPALEARSAREAGRGADFSTNLEGGALAGLLSLETPAEFFKLLFRAFALAVQEGGDQGSSVGLDPSWDGWDGVRLGSAGSAGSGAGDGF